MGRAGDEGPARGHKAGLESKSHEKEELEQMLKRRPSWRCPVFWNFAHFWLLLAPDMRTVGRICSPCGFNISQKAKPEEKLKRHQVQLWIN